MFWGTGLNKEEVSLYTHHKNWHGNNRVRLLYQNWITNKSRYPEDFAIPRKGASAQGQPNIEEFLRDLGIRSGG